VGCGVGTARQAGGLQAGGRARRAVRGYLAGPADAKLLLLAVLVRRAAASQSEDPGQRLCSGRAGKLAAVGNGPPRPTTAPDHPNAVSPVSTLRSTSGERSAETLFTIERARATQRTRACRHMAVARRTGARASRKGGQRIQCRACPSQVSAGPKLTGESLWSGAITQPRPDGARVGLRQELLRARNNLFQAGWGHLR
jgi:hypothetical protein